MLCAPSAESLNVVLVRPDPPPSPTSGGAEEPAIEAAAVALRRAAGVSAPYVLVAADPLAGVAAAWQAMWDITAGARGSDEFELRAAGAMAAWRAKQFELPDYYLVLAEESTAGRVGDPESGRPQGAGVAGAAAGEPRPDFYLGPGLRTPSRGPNRVAVAAGTSPAAQADALLGELGTLRHGPWWPSLDEVFRTARGFYPGSLAESMTSQAATSLLR